MQVPPHIPGESDPDIVVAMIREVLEIVPLTDEQARQIERRLKDQYGGERVRVRKSVQLEAQARRAQVYQDGLTNMDNRQITSKHGISRATLYRIMKEGLPPKTSA